MLGAVDEAWRKQRSLPMALILSSGERGYRTSDGGAGLSFNIMV